MLKKRYLFLAILMIAVLALAACVPVAPGESTAGESMADHATLVVYSSVDEENSQKLLDAFTAQTGIPVEMVFLSSGPALSRIEAESNNPQADVWFGAPNENHIIAKEQGLTQPHVSASAADLPDNFKDAEGYWHAMYMNPVGIGILAEELEGRGVALPTSWADLTNEEYAGLIQMPSPQSSGTAYAIMQTLITLLGEDGAFEYMVALNPNIQTYTQSGTAPSKALAIKETLIGIQFTPAFLQLIDEGFPAQLVIPEEGVSYEAAAVSIIAGAPHAAEAEALVDWITSLDGQNALSTEKTYFFPVRSDAEVGEGLPALSTITLVDYDRAAAAADKERLVERWVTEVLGQ